MSCATTHLGLLASTAGSVGDAWASDHLRWSVSNLEPPSCSPGSIWQSDCLPDMCKCPSRSHQIHSWREQRVWLLSQSWVRSGQPHVFTGDRAEGSERLGKPEGMERALRRDGVMITWLPAQGYPGEGNWKGREGVPPSTRSPQDLAHPVFSCWGLWKSSGINPSLAAPSSFLAFHRSGCTAGMASRSGLRACSPHASLGAVEGAEPLLLRVGEEWYHHPDQSLLEILPSHGPSPSILSHHSWLRGRLSGAPVSDIDIDGPASLEHVGNLSSVVPSRGASAETPRQGQCLVTILHT